MDLDVFLKDWSSYNNLYTNQMKLIFKLFTIIDFFLFFIRLSYFEWIWFLLILLNPKSLNLLSSMKLSYFSYLLLFFPTNQFNNIYISGFEGNQKSTLPLKNKLYAKNCVFFISNNTNEQLIKKRLNSSYLWFYNTNIGNNI